MKILVLTLLTLFVSGTSFASQRVSQYCTGKISIDGQSKLVTYYDGCGMEEKPCFISINIDQEKKSFSLHSGANIRLYPASESEVVLLESSKEEILIVLQRTGSNGTLTYLNDQNQILSNLPVQCMDNDDK